MAIKRLTREASFPLIGKLRKGGVRPESGKAPGKDLTYFRFDSDDAHATKCFTAAYGDQPAQVNVFLPHQTASQNFSCWQEAYVAGGLTHRCDGETCVIWLDGKKYSTEPKPCPGGCKEVGRLMVIIPELQRFAYVTVETHSINDIIRLQENLQAVEFLRGDLRGIPFILKRTPVEISTPTPDGKRARREKWLLSIEVDPVWASLQLEAMHRAALSVNGATVDESRMLTTSYDEDDEEDVDVVTTEVTPAKVQPAVQHRTHRAPEPISQPISTGDEATKLFHKRITAAFAGLDVEDARHWYISQYTDGAANSTKDLTPAQLSEMAEDLRKFTTLARQKYQEWRDTNRQLDGELFEPEGEQVAAF
jgi:hypothetical protein